jgi:hypothetical protein
LLGLEVLVGLQAVARHAEHLGVGGFEGFELIAKALALVVQPGVLSFG